MVFDREKLGFFTMPSVLGNGVENNFKTIQTRRTESFPGPRTTEITNSTWVSRDSAP